MVVGPCCRESFPRETLMSPDEPRWKLSPSARTCGGSPHLRWPNLHLEKSTETLKAHNTLRLALLMLTKQRDGPGLTYGRAGA